MRFSLANHIYAGKCNQDIIILDCEHDKYLNITDEAARGLETVLQKEFILIDGNYAFMDDQNGDAVISKMITHFLYIGIIKVAEQHDSRSSLPTAVLPGGLSNFKWDYKASMKSFSSVSKIGIVKALLSLIRMEFIRRRYGIKGIIRALEKAQSKASTANTYNALLIQELSDSVDVACALYPKKVYCLGWASTFTLLATKKGIRANLVIGVQNMPFYAHAWAEVGGKVINDDSRVRTHLTPLLTTPSNKLSSTL